MDLKVALVLYCLVCGVVLGTDEKQGSVAVQDEKSDGDQGHIEVSEVSNIEIDESLPPFIATDEWQEIKPGQAVPSGLHYRINFETGVREAKLLDKDESQKLSTGTQLLPVEANDNGEETQDGDDRYSHAALKEALKNFKADQDDVKEPLNMETGDSKHFRTANEIKKDFEDLELIPKTDLEILRELYNRYNDTDLVDVEERKTILTDLEYYLHQIDNAQNFAEMGGLSLVFRDLNHTSPDIRSEAALVVGAAVQSNPKVKTMVIEQGTLQKLIQMLSREPDEVLKKRALYAISCLVRDFPFAQQRFLHLGGMTALGHLFNMPQGEKLQLKALALVTDLANEQKHAGDHPVQETREEKVKQYERVPLLKAIKEQGWCNHVTIPLASDNNNSIETSIGAMAAIFDQCAHSFSGNVFVENRLGYLKGYFNILAQEELNESPSDGHYTGIVDTLTTLIDKLQSEMYRKTEL